MAAYIDLNPVRAGICEDPKDYRWCGYAEAVAGGKLARQAISWLAELNPHGGMKSPEKASSSRSAQKEPLRKWRCHLFGVPENEIRQAEEKAKKGRASLYRVRISRDKALEVLAKGGRLSEADYLRCKVRYFSDGAVLGGKSFVEGIFEACRDRFSPKRKDGARPLRGLATSSKEERLFNFRQLRTGVFS